MADLNSIGGLHYEMMRRCYNEKSVMYNTYGASNADFLRTCSAVICPKMAIIQIYP